MPTKHVQTPDQVFWSHTQNLEFIDFAVRFQVGELKKQWISTVWELENVKKSLPQYHFRKQHEFPMNLHRFWISLCTSGISLCTVWNKSVHHHGWRCENVTFLKVDFFDFRNMSFRPEYCMWRKVNCFTMVSASEIVHLYNVFEWVSGSSRF